MHVFSCLLLHPDHPTAPCRRPSWRAFCSNMDSRRSSRCRRAAAAAACGRRSGRERGREGRTGGGRQGERGVRILRERKACVIASQTHLDVSTGTHSVFAPRRSQWRYTGAWARHRSSALLVCLLCPPPPECPPPAKLDGGYAQAAACIEAYEMYMQTGVPRPLPPQEES